MKEIKNISASIHARLQNLARARNKPFQEILQYYCIERFLYRLSKTKYSTRFILKGGLVFYSLGVSERRTTRDIDFRGYINNDKDKLLEILKSAFEISIFDDGLVFIDEGIVFEETMVDADYSGMRIHFTACLGKAKIPLQLDIGFSDVITPDAKFGDFPVLLDGMEPPHLKTYPIESIISEKFHAMVRLAEINSRWKDFYDIWLLSEIYNIDGKLLQSAIKSTFDQRETSIPEALPVAFTDVFAEENQKNWYIFIKRNNLAIKQIEDLKNVIYRLRIFLMPPIQFLLKAEIFDKKWLPRNNWS